ncbi:MAG: hypothetical protein IJS29_06165 [Selenomonadaceae bacterium]|nr:hypothetical protein [Selenomonadaceae bacterium]
MATIFKGNNAKFPANESELTTRLSEIENLINADKANIPFVESAFKLMEDCGLITQDNIKFLMDAIALKCKHRHFRFPYLSNEGVLRQVTNYNDVFDSNNFPRFYKGNDRRVELDGKMYVIANDWYKDNTPCPNKRPFFNWLADKATTACKAHWNAQIAVAPPAPKKPSAAEVMMTSINKVDNSMIQLDNKVNVLYSNLMALNNKIDELSANMAQLNNRVENLSNYMAQTANSLNNLDKLPAHMAEFNTLKGKVDQLNAQIETLKRNGLTVTAHWNN